MSQAVNSILRAPAVEAVRHPPQAIEAEQHVIGALMLWPESYDRIDWLLPSHFYRSDHRAIYTAIESLLQAGKQADVFLVASALESAGKLEDCGGRTYIGSLAANTPSAAGIVSYAEKVLERWRLREIVAKGVEIADAAYDRNADPLAIAESVDAAFQGVLEAKRAGELTPFGRAVGDAVDAREAPAEAIVSTGYIDLDHMLKGGGFRPGQLVIIAGRSSMGKSALAWGIAEHVAARAAVAGFTLEMGGAELAERALSHHERLVGQSDAIRHLHSLKLFLDESPAITLSHVRLHARRLKRRHGIGLIVVDYLQLMTSKGENRTQEVGALARGLKAVAKELHVPVIAVAQINRGVEQRQDKRPLLSDLRESGDIENDADVVMMIYRDDYYVPDSPARGFAEILIRKQRNGPVGMVPLSFDAATTRFENSRGPIPRPVAAPKVRNFADYKSKAAGDE